jgi:hypothetical protein
MAIIVTFFLIPIQIGFFPFNSSEKNNVLKYVIDLIPMEKIPSKSDLK